MTILTAIVDAHVHLHTCYRADELLDNAARNLSAACPQNATGCALYLLMAECQQDDCFGQFRELAVSDDPARRTALGLKEWSIAPTAEDSSVLATSGEQNLFIVAGRQVACREGLEVLVLGTTRKFEDGRPIRELLRETEALRVPRVIPWGPGKWLFSRGRLLNQLLQEFRKPTLFLGDEGGRPGFWGYPAHFALGARLGVRDLPGTDPLPFSHDVGKVGRMGFRVPIALDRRRPAASLLRSLTDPNVAFDRFATLEPPVRFVRNQIGMQLRKRRPPASTSRGPGPNGGGPTGGASAGGPTHRVSGGPTGGASAGGPTHRAGGGLRGGAGAPTRGPHAGGPDAGRPLSG